MFVYVYIYKWKKNDTTVMFVYNIDTPVQVEGKWLYIELETYQCILGPFTSDICIEVDEFDYRLISAFPIGEINLYATIVITVSLNSSTALIDADPGIGC